MVIRNSFILLFGLLFFPTSAMAGAWVPAPGSGYHKLAYNYFRAKDTFGSNQDLDRFVNSNFSYYGEVGLVPRLALYGGFSFVQLEQQAGGVRTDYLGIGDVDVGLRYNLFTDPFVLSGSVLFKLPYLYDQTNPLPPGNGQEDIELRLLFGKSLDQWGYVGFESAYRFRLEEPSDELRLLFEYGKSLNDYFYVRTKLDIIESIKNGDEISQGVGNPSLNPEFDLGRLELTLGLNLLREDRIPEASRWGLEFTYTRDLYGDETLKGDTFQLGLTLAY